MDWITVLEDSQNYPDTMKINVSGQEMVLGDLRGSPAFKGFTRYSQEQSKERKEIEDRLNQAISDRDKAAQDLTVAMSRSAPPETKVNVSDPLSAFRSDPTFAPLMEAVDRANARAEALERKAVLFEQNVWLNAHISSLKEIQAKDAEFKDPAKVNELLSYAKNNGLANLTLAHQTLTRERDIQKAIEEGKRTGMEEGKKKALADMTMIPSGTRRLLSPAPEAPKTFDEAEEAALSDPEILNTFQGMT